MWTRFERLARSALMLALACGAAAHAPPVLGQQADGTLRAQQGAHAAADLRRLDRRIGTRRIALARGPWPARRRTGVRVVEPPMPGLPPLFDPDALTPLELRALGLRGGPRTQVAIEHWPKEPASPSRVAPQAFGRALRALCPRQVPDATVERIAEAALSAANAWSVDPFAIAALAYHQSRCEPRVRDSYGIGLTRINLGMHAAHVREGHYHYGLPMRPRGYAHASVALDGHEFSARALLEPETNLYFAAAFLHVFEAQCPTIDAAFGAAPHRHPISHVIFGDGVRSALPEAQVLTARRRLLAYYADRDLRVCTRCAGLAAAAGTDLGSPLDGPPRIVTGVMGDPRDRGRRLHAGIDLMASEGEPVRTVNSGTVISAGVDLRRRGLLDLPPERAASVPPRNMGPRGLFVRIDHGDGLVSLYAHLARYSVCVGERVERGQIIGAIGRTGVHTSDAHLHFGLFDNDRAIDPLVRLEPHVLAVERGFVLDLDRLHERLRSARRRP